MALTISLNNAGPKQQNGHKNNHSEKSLKMNHSIKQWPEQERPRERLIRQGASSLSDAELLAIFLRSGSKQHSAVELARLLLQHFGGLNPIFDARLDELNQFHGVGESKYAQLMAVKELGRRYIAQHLKQEKIELSHSKVLLDFLKFELLGETQEVFVVLCLDSHLRKISFKKMFYGSFGIAQPSEADLSLTRKILQACQLVEINLIDHCIVSPEGTCSFAEHGLIQAT